MCGFLLLEYHKVLLGQEMMRMMRGEIYVILLEREMVGIMLVEYFVIFLEHGTP